MSSPSLPVAAPRPAVRGEAERLALALLAATLAGIYAIGAATTVPTSPALAAVQGAVALAQLAFAAFVAVGSPRPIARRLGAAGQIALVGLWVVSRTIGLGGPRLPVGILDAACVADELLLAACVLYAAGPRRARTGTSMLRCQLAAMLAGMTVFALGAAHHAAVSHGRFFGGRPGAHYFCRPL